MGRVDKKTHQELKKLKNEYKNKVIQKNVPITKLRELMKKIKTLDAKIKRIEFSGIKIK